MALSVSTNQEEYFIKWNELEFVDMFEKEAFGLEILASLNIVSIPEVIGFGQIEEKSFLVLEHLNETYVNTNYWENLGESLAKMHQVNAPNCGLAHDNYIGRLYQKNHPIDCWKIFYREQRLNHQLGLAIYNNYVEDTFVKKYKRFLDRIDDILPESKPCLLHGDLWNGNIMCAYNKAYIFDPAVYYGAPEMDLAMTRLFGGFSDEFYAAYNEVNPISNHFEELLDIYQLYPLMVHVNLFGPNAGYLGSVKRIIDHYL